MTAASWLVALLVACGRPSGGHRTDGCEAHPTDPGCPCAGGEPEVCYTGPEGTLDVGTCAAGLTHCEPDGQWGPCDGEVVPHDEACDGLDDDCDGQPDDGVLGACGVCGECKRDCSGPDDGCDGWDEGLGTGVVETREGWLTLDAHPASLHVIWPSSARTGQIFRVDTETLAIQGAYWTGPFHGGTGGLGSDSPSRTAVDDEGSVVIANRAFGIQGSITHVASDESLCVDRNRNGIIDTSTGWNDLLPFDAPDSFDDECILWSTQVPPDDIDAVPRALAIHPEVGLDGVTTNMGWIGLYNRARFDQFDVDTGERTGTSAPTPGFSPYGAAIDRDGWVWASGPETPYAVRFDTASPEDSFEVLPLGGNGIFRVIVDENDAPWVSGHGLWRWNRDLEAFEEAVIEDLCGGYMFGNIASDGRGSIWMGTYNNGSCVYRVTNDPGGAHDLESHPIDTDLYRTFGTAVDFDGHAWAFDYSNGDSAIIDLETEETRLVLRYDECGGDHCLASPYIREDITGLQRRNALGPSGVWSKVVEGCDGADTDWTRVTVDAETPPGASLSLDARGAPTLGGLASASWVRLGVVPVDGSALDLDALDGSHFVELRVTFSSRDWAAVPVLRSVEIGYACDSILN